MGKQPQTLLVVMPDAASTFGQYRSNLANRLPEVGAVALPIPSGNAVHAIPNRIPAGQATVVGANIQFGLYNGHLDFMTAQEFAASFARIGNYAGIITDPGQIAKIIAAFQITF